MIKFKDSIDIEPGIYYDIPHQEYRKWDAFSYSMVRSTLKSQKALYNYLYSERDATTAMTLGNLVETELLEPELTKDMFVVQPETYEKTERKRNKETKEMENVTVKKPWNYQSRTCREWRDNQLKNGLEIITLDQIVTANQMCENMHAHEAISKVLKDYKKQVSIVWVDINTGVKCKGRIDILRDDMILDLKTTDDIEVYKFSSKIAKFLYHVQAAMYCDGLQNLEGSAMLPYNFIASEYVEPYDCVLYELGENSIISGRELYKDALAKYKSYQESGIITGYSTVPEPIDIPHWAMKIPDDHIDI